MKIKTANIYVVPCGNRRGVILELETDSGLSGIGEAGIAYGIGTMAAAEMVKAMAERFVLGRDPARIELIWNDIYDGGFWTKGGGAISFAGLSAIEHALWDIKGKDLGAPVYSLLGGPVEDALEVYANGWWLGCDTGAEYARAGAAAVARGYRSLKLYPLGVADPVVVVRHPARRSLDRSAMQRVEERCRALREAVGPDIDIMLDFGGGLTTDRVLRVLRTVEPFDIAFVEEPADPAMPHVLADIARKTTIPVAAGERVYSRYGFHKLFQAGGVSIVQPDVCNTGGIMEARKIAAMAEIHNLRVAPHNYGSTLATAVSVHLAAAIPNFMVLECFPGHASEPGYVEVLEEPLEAKVENGRMPLPTGPGLGVSLNRKAVEAHLWSRLPG